MPVYFRSIYFFVLVIIKRMDPTFSRVRLSGKKIARLTRQIMKDGCDIDPQLYGVTHSISSYSQTGGKTGKEKVYTFVHQFIDNRALDVYLKLLGIGTLSTTTLVPIALLFGQKSFEDAIRVLKKKKEGAEKLLKKKTPKKSKSWTDFHIPIIDNTYMGTYLKLAGVVSISLTLDTLVPLGLAMAIWETIRRYNKKHDNRTDKTDKKDNKKDKLKRKKDKEQHGGYWASALAGDYVPPGNLQLLVDYTNGVDISNNIDYPLTSGQQLNRGAAYENHELQVSKSDGCVAKPFPSGQPQLQVQTWDGSKFYDTHTSRVALPGGHGHGNVASELDVTYAEAADNLGKLAREQMYRVPMA